MEESGDEGNGRKGGGGQSVELRARHVSSIDIKGSSQGREKSQIQNIFGGCC